MTDDHPPEEQADETAPPPPQPPELGLAIERFDAGDLDGCEALLDAARTQPDSDGCAEIALFEGLCARRRGDLERAVERLREAARQAPTAPEMQTELALALIERGASQEGLDALREAVRLSDDAPLLRHEFYLQNGLALHREGYLDAAITSLRKALRFESDVDTRTLLGHLLIEAGRLDEAVDLIAETAERFPGCASVHLLAGLVFSIKQQPIDAAQAFARAAEIEPGRADPLHGMGLCFESLGDASRAIETYERCLRLECTEEMRYDLRERLTRLRGEATAP